MPHTHIHFSSHFDDFDFKPLMMAIAHAYVTHCNATHQATLGYTDRLMDVLVAADPDGADKAVLSIKLSMKSGRDQDQKNALMLNVHDDIVQHVKPFILEQGFFCEPRVELTELTADYMSMS